MRRLTLSEHTSRAYPSLARPVAEAFAATGAVKASIDFAGRTVLTSSSHVGVLRSADVELRITPKISIHRVLWLIGHARDPRGWREQDIVSLSAADDLVSALAVSFLAAARRAFAAGVLQGYRTTEEAQPMLRGRLREGDQLRSRLGIAVPLEVRYDDYTVDIPENRLLLAAALRLLRIPGLPNATQSGLRRVLTMLADVTPLVAREVPPVTTDTRLTRRYQPALRLARLAMAGRSLDQPPGSKLASGFMFDLNTVFENWLTVVLGRALAPYGGRLAAQFHTHLDEDGRIPIRPDLVWECQGRPGTVLDAKYKRTTPDDRSNADIYQMLAYCTALGLPAGHLVYASGEPSRHYIVRRAGIRIQTWALDLSQSIGDVLNQVDRLAAGVASDRGS